MQAGNGYMDTQYSNAFFTSNSTIRPGMWMKAMPNVFNLQNTWGWTNPYDATGCRNIESISLRYPFRFVSSDIFSSDAEEAAIVLDTANRLVTYSGTFTTLQLQNYFNNCGGGLGGTPNPTNAYNNTGNFIDSLAYGLPVMRFWAVPSGTTDAIVTWANALFTGGHDFATDTAATCAWVGVPRVLKCSNVP